MSPLLANVVLNELDWWIAGQWEMFKIREGKTGLEFNKTDKEGNVLTVDRTQKWNKLRAKTELKEMYIVRYADYTEFQTMPKKSLKYLWYMPSPLKTSA